MSRISRFTLLLVLVLALASFAVPTFAASPEVPVYDAAVSEALAIVEPGSTVGRLGETLGYTFQYTAPSTMADFMVEVSNTSTTFIPNSVVLLVAVACAAIGVGFIMLRRFSKAFK